MFTFYRDYGGASHGTINEKKNTLHNLANFAHSTKMNSLI